MEKAKKKFFLKGYLRVTKACWAQVIQLSEYDK